MKSFFDYFTKNKIDPSWAYNLILAIPVRVRERAARRRNTWASSYATEPTLLATTRMTIASY